MPATAAEIGAALAGRRKALKLTQAKLAERMSLSQNRLSELEPAPDGLTVAQLLALAHLLGLELRPGERPIDARQKAET